MEIDYLDKEVETASREVLDAIQFRKLKSLVEKVYESNQFYIRKFKEHGVRPEDIRTLNDISKLPFTYKVDFQEDQEKNPIFGTNLTEPLANYARYHQTTGTTGKPLKWLDTKESWQWRGRCAATIFTAIGIKKDDIFFFPFAFGPHAAYWGLFEGAWQIGSMTIPGGGWDTLQRLESILQNRATVLACTPTYALRLAEVAEEKNIDIRNSAVRIIVDGGEPGASIPVIKRKIESVWDAKFYDYIGSTETSAHSFGCLMQEYAVHVNEGEFIPEVIDSDTGAPVEEGELGELVLTNLGRVGSPAIRYRTGDIVRYKKSSCLCGRTYRMLDGGILGRKDDMVIIRGMNIFPTMVGNVVQKHLSVGDEYRVVAYTKGSLSELKILLDLSGSNEVKRENIRNDIALDLRSTLEIRAEVEVLPENTLEKFDYKAKRFIDKREIR